MQINLFTYTGETERINKSDYITNRFVLNGVLKSSTSILTPIIVIEKSCPPEYDYNYMYIPIFKRWYYITDFKVLRNNLWELSARVDVLHSYKDIILNSKAVISKSQDGGKANLYMDDGSFVLDSRKYNRLINFPHGLSQDGTFVLICAGGVGNAS